VINPWRSLGCHRPSDSVAQPHVFWLGPRD
jgi:hypothetical protein